MTQLTIEIEIAVVVGAAVAGSGGVWCWISILRNGTRRVSLVIKFQPSKIFWPWTFANIMPLYDNKSFAYFIVKTHSNTQRDAHELLRTYQNITHYFYHQSQKRRKIHLYTTTTHKMCREKSNTHTHNNKYQICLSSYWNCWFYCSFRVDAISIILNDSPCIVSFLLLFRRGRDRPSFPCHLPFIDYAMGFQNVRSYWVYTVHCTVCFSLQPHIHSVIHSSCIVPFVAY